MTTRPCLFTFITRYFQFLSEMIALASKAKIFYTTLIGVLNLSYDAFSEGFNGVTHQPLNSLKFNRQPSKKVYFYRQPYWYC